MKFPASRILDAAIFGSILSAVALAIALSFNLLITKSDFSWGVQEAARKGFNAGVHHAVKVAIEKKLLLAPSPTSSSFAGCIFVRVVLWENAPLLEIGNLGKGGATITNCSFIGYSPEETGAGAFISTR